MWNAILAPVQQEKHAKTSVFDVETGPRLLLSKRHTADGGFKQWSLWNRFVLFFSLFNNKYFINECWLFSSSFIFKGEVRHRICRRGHRWQRVPEAPGSTIEGMNFTYLVLSIIRNNSWVFLERHKGLLLLQHHEEADHRW